MSIFWISVFSDELNFFCLIFFDSILLVSKVSFFGANEVTSDTFNISIGIIWGIGILFGLKKSGRPIANNKIDK